MHVMYVCIYKNDRFGIKRSRSVLQCVVFVVVVVCLFFVCLFVFDYLFLFFVFVIFTLFGL